MSFNTDSLQWLPIGISFVAGQIFLTVYFTAIFGERWALAYGPNKTPKEHTREVPKYTYAIGAASCFGVALTVALLQAGLAVDGISGALELGALLSVGLVAATITPGYAFLRRWDAYWLAVGSQIALVLLVSAIIGGWPR